MTDAPLGIPQHQLNIMVVITVVIVLAGPFSILLLGGLYDLVTRYDAYCPRCDREFRMSPDDLLAGNRPTCPRCHHRSGEV